MVLCQGYFDRI